MNSEIEEINKKLDNKLKDLSNDEKKEVKDIINSIIEEIDIKTEEKMDINDKILNYYVAEYSTLQNCFNCCTLKDSIFANLRTIDKKIINDYKIIGIFKTLDEALEYNKKMKKEFQRKEIKEKEDIIDELVNKISNIINEY